jgi:hypothetical protein
MSPLFAGLGGNQGAEVYIRNTITCYIVFFRFNISRGFRLV